MVVFTCNHCGESLQKPRVEKHYSTICRSYKDLTCVDCLKDFRNEEYVVHTKCFTEDERYAAKGSIPGGIVQKGEVKQESWLQMIKGIAEEEQNVKPSVKNLLQTISGFANVPRKKPKFVNFLKSSTGGRVHITDIEAAWDIIEKHKISKQNNNAQTNGQKRKASEDVSKNGVVSSKKLKPSENTDESIEKFSFKQTIINILTKKGQISSKKLQKKVLTAYTSETGNEATAKTIKKYNKKLSVLPNVKIDVENAVVSLSK